MLRSKITFSLQLQRKINYKPNVRKWSLNFSRYAKDDKLNAVYVIYELKKVTGQPSVESISLLSSIRSPELQFLPKSG